MKPSLRISRSSIACRLPSRSLADALTFPATEASCDCGPRRMPITSSTLPALRVMPYWRAIASLSRREGRVVTRTVTSPVRSSAGASASVDAGIVRSPPQPPTPARHAQARKTEIRTDTRVGTSVVGTRQLATARGGIGDRAGDEVPETAGFEGFDRGLGRAAGGGHAPAQLGRVGVAFGEHARRAEQCVQGQDARNF